MTDINDIQTLQQQPEGQQFDRMFREMAEAGNPAPEYKQVEFMVKVRLNSALREEGTNGIGVNEKVKEKVNEKQKDIVEAQESTQKSTLKSTLKSIPQIAEQLGMNPRGIDKHLKALRELGIIRRVGPDKGGHWEVVEPKEKRGE